MDREFVSCNACNGYVGRPISLPSCLANGDALGVNECLFSPDGRFKFCYTTTGDICTYELFGGTPMWCLGKSVPFPGSLQILTNGKLQLVDSSGEVYYSYLTGDYTGKGVFLTMQDDRNIVLYNNDNVAIWACNFDRWFETAGPLDCVWEDCFYGNFPACSTCSGYFKSSTVTISNPSVSTESAPSGNFNLMLHAEAPALTKAQLDSTMIDGIPFGGKSAKTRAKDVEEAAAVTNKSHEPKSLRSTV
jgi:hypothetical protein